MKKLWITLLIITVVGLCLWTAGFFLGAATNFYFDFEGFHVIEAGSGEIQEDMNLPEFTEIKIDSSSAHIEVVEGEKYGIYIENNITGKSHYSVDNGVLNVRQPNAIGFFMFNWLSSTDVIKIYLPKDAVLNKADVDFASGKFEIKSIDCDDINVDMASGKIILTDLKSNKIRITYASGTTTLDNVTANDAKFEFVSGSLNARNINFKKIALDLTSGNADVSGVINGDIEIDMTSGNVKMDIDAPENNFSKKIDKMSGSVIINGNSVDTQYDKNAPYEIDVDITSGGVKIDFTK